MKNKFFSILLISSIVVVGFLCSNNSDKAETKKNFFSEKENEQHSDAMDALQFFSQAAAFPDKDIPANAYASAMDWYKQNALTNRNAQTTTSWQSIGPRNMGGRTIAIAFDPTDTATIWLGSASGGLWKSTTGGIGANAWNYVPLGFPVLGVSSIAINPSNKNEMYVGSGEVYSYGSNSQGIGDIRATRGSYGMGLFKSVNGGTTWSQVINWTYNQNRGIWDIVINPLKPTTVYAATTEGVYKSVDAGTTWNLILNQKMCMDLEMHSVDTNILLCGVGNYGSVVQGVYRTTNSGATWAQNTSGLPSTAYQGRITFTKYKNNNDIMYTHLCDVYNTVGIYKSIDKGATWVQQTTQNISSYQGFYTKGLLIQPGNPNNVLAGGVYVYSSTTGGTSFNQSNGNYHSDVHDIVGNPSAPNKIYVITDGGLFRSNDFGNTFYECTGGYVTTQHYIGSVSATDTTVLLSGLQDNYTIKYFGAYTWQAMIGGDGCYNAIDHTNDQIQYGAYQYLNVFSDNTQGNNFATQVLSNSSSATGGNYAAFLAPYILCYSNTQYIYAGGKALQRSTDAGATWNYMGNNPVNNGTQIMAVACSFTNTDSVYFGTAPDQTNNMKMFFSPNGGASVTDISSGLPNRFPRRIAVNPKDSREVYAVFSGFGTGHVFKSTNNGATWTDMSTNLPNMPFECVIVDPTDPNFVYVGCDYGVFVSADKGVTWNPYDTGFPDATMVFDLVISPSSRYMYAFTHGRGIFKRDLRDLATGINSSSKNDITIKLFPNPATDEIKLNLNNTKGDKFTAYIYNMEGKQQKSFDMESNENKIPVTDLAAGAYIVSVRKNNVPFKYLTFIKQ
ncbi:MAG TPA: T9SS type A sorting domain-containing protein [Bacteroidia bacterium]|jgi:photosystem II stability/assembly factor-like uncharacterized protein|nr:T9SS type A sorting domain-containing protein [Bacteroidia bacterium]